MQSEEKYNKNIEEIKYILKGDLDNLENYLKDEMNKAAEDLRFEEAQEIKEKLRIHRKIQIKIDHCKSATTQHRCLLLSTLTMIMPLSII